MNNMTTYRMNNMNTQNISGIHSHNMINKRHLVYCLLFALTMIVLVSCRPSIEKDISAFDNAVSMLEENQNVSTFDDVEELNSICEDNMTALNDRLSDFTPEQIKRVSAIKKRYKRICSIISCNVQLAELEKSMTTLESNNKNLPSEVLKDSICILRSNIDSFKNKNIELSEYQKERLSDLEERYNQFCIDVKFNLQVSALEESLEKLNGYKDLKPIELEKLLRLCGEQLNELKNEKQSLTSNQETIVNDFEKRYIIVVGTIKADQKTREYRNLSHLLDWIEDILD